MTIERGTERMQDQRLRLVPALVCCPAPRHLILGISEADK